MGIPDHLTCLLGNLYVGQEATVRTLYGTTDWFKFEKGARQGCLLLSCVFNLCSECIMRNARLDELQAGIKIGGKNINNLRYVDDTTLMAESEEEIKNFLIKVKEKSEKTWLKTTFTKLTSWHLVPSLHGKYMGKKWKQWQIFFSWPPKSLWTVHKLKMLVPWKDSYHKSKQHIKKQRHSFANKGPCSQSYGFFQ